MMIKLLFSVIPAVCKRESMSFWIPASAGMTLQREENGF